MVNQLNWGHDIPEDLGKILFSMVNGGCIEEWYLKEIVDDMMKEDESVNLIFGFCWSHLSQAAKDILYTLVDKKDVDRLHDLNLTTMAEMKWVEPTSGAYKLPIYVEAYMRRSTHAGYMKTVEQHAKEIMEEPEDGDEDLNPIEELQRSLLEMAELGKDAIAFVSPRNFKIIKDASK